MQYILDLDSVTDSFERGAIFFKLEWIVRQLNNFHQVSLDSTNSKLEHLNVTIDHLLNPSSLRRSNFTPLGCLCPTKRQ